MGTDELEKEIAQSDIYKQLLQQNLEPSPLDFPAISHEEAIEIHQDYIPSAIREMIKNGASRADVEAALARIRQRKISLIADNGNQTPTDVYDEISYGGR